MKCHAKYPQLIHWNRWFFQCGLWITSWIFKVLCGSQCAADCSAYIHICCESLPISRSRKKWSGSSLNSFKHYLHVTCWNGLKLIMIDFFDVWMNRVWFCLFFFFFVFIFCLLKCTQRLVPPSNMICWKYVLGKINDQKLLLNCV